MRIDNHYLYDIGSEQFAKKKGLFKFGAGTAGTTETVIWDGNDGYSGFITSPVKVDVVSESIDDVYGTGVGAWDVLVYGLDVNFKEVNEYIKLNGTTPVTSKTEFIRVFRAFTINGGSDAKKSIQGANQGDINIFKTGLTGDPGDLMAKIKQFKGQTLMCIFTVPAEKSLLVTGVSASIGKGKDSTFSFKARNFPITGVFSTKYDIKLYQSLTTQQLLLGLLIPEKTDIIVTAKTDVASEVTASFAGILIENSEL